LKWGSGGRKKTADTRQRQEGKKSKNKTDKKIINTHTHTRKRTDHGGDKDALKSSKSGGVVRVRTVRHTVRVIKARKNKNNDFSSHHFRTQITKVREHERRLNKGVRGAG